MKTQLDLSLILPCYNESSVFNGSVSWIMHTLERSGLSYEIIFVDDCGSDNTRELITKTCKKFPPCRAIYHEVNTGRGRTVNDGFMLAKGEVVGYIDIDCEVSPVYIPDMVDIILEKKSDVVIGKRIYRTSISALPREVFSLGYQWLSNVLIHTDGLDTESGYKFFRRAKVLPLLSKATHPHWFWDTEIMVFAKRAGLNIVEVPVLFLRRFDKQSSVRVWRDIGDYLINLLKFRRRLSLEDGI
jgi:glycosyltransferase AglD